MVYLQYITYLLLATPIVVADYYVDNANTSVTYSMAPSQSGQGWQTLSVSTQSLGLEISNSTGNYTIPLDASHCYDQNYALGVCGTNDNCFVQIPFTGSGITMYVFSAGASGMTASFSVDGGGAVSNSIDAPPPPTYQVSNVSLYDIQGLTTGNHTMVMTMLNWNGSPTSMKFDYAHINETSVEPPATTSQTSHIGSTSTSQVSSTQTPSQTSSGNLSTSNKSNIGALVGGVVGGLIGLATAVIGCFYLHRRRGQRQAVLDSTLQANPFVPEYSDSPTPPSRAPFTGHLEASPSITPSARSAILQSAFAVGTQPVQGSQSIRSGTNSFIFQSPHQQRSSIADTDSHMSPPSVAGLAGTEAPFSTPRFSLEHNLTAEQREVIDRLQMSHVPADTISRVIEGYVHSRLLAGEQSSAKVTRDGSVLSTLPPSYQTRDH